MNMKISEVEGLDNEKAAADTLKKNADNLKQQATAADARLKVKAAQQQLVKAVQPIKPK
jgi:hypothetical protein